ncbi:MAG: cell envelope integrity EipB family protein [Rhodospirillales bacterium]|nr:cell envelope integrity EipB family protein [Rhodospirillales bacterium]
MLNPLKPILIACVLVAASTPGAWAVELASHRAAYDVTLAVSSDTAAVTAANGQIAYGVEKVCGGWLSAQSGTMNLQLTSGEVMPQTLHYSSWEADGGNQYRFSVKVEGNGDEVILGTAQIGSGAEGVANFTRPEPKQFVLPRGTVFPVSHTASVIEAARAGKTQSETYIFEGTEVEGAKLLIAFISPLSKEAKAVQEQLGGELLTRSGWNFRLAYFDPKNQTGEPLYEVEADLLDNGVTLRWILDYGVYAVEIKLNKVERLVKPDC